MKPYSIVVMRKAIIIAALFISCVAFGQKNTYERFSIGLSTNGLIHNWYFTKYRLFAGLEPEFIYNITESFSIGVGVPTWFKTKYKNEPVTTTVGTDFFIRWNVVKLNSLYISLDADWYLHDIVGIRPAIILFPKNNISLFITTGCLGYQLERKESFGLDKYSFYERVGLKYNF